MNFAWRDYNPETMGFVEEWIDEVAVKMTGMEDGFRQEYEYCLMKIIMLLVTITGVPKKQQT